MLKKYDPDVNEAALIGAVAPSSTYNHSLIGFPLQISTG